ncbi:DNA helicase RecQ [Poriferisphaera sp. WC338]|uniref:DNA helicase RecQ n=1 Tax=Poriferisphaera sp. WC338 TaxID=3425129 RepID=UPI003D816650
MTTIEATVHAGTQADSEGTLRLSLEQHFSFTNFRSGQLQVIQAVLAGRDALVIMPTGGGKSLCYQLPSLMLNGVTLVVSPLIALMQDQVDFLQAKGIAATCINSSLDPSEAAERERGVIRGDFQLVYLAPERLMSAAGERLLNKIDLSLLAIDEAHCISEWGHDFRPEYRQLGAVRECFAEKLRGVPILALTATATPRVAGDITQQLGMSDPLAYCSSFERDNLQYYVRPKQQFFDQILAYVRQHPADAGIIYCQSRNQVDKLAERLSVRGVNALPYHAGMDSETRSENQRAFMSGEARVIVATIAFGMGIDKADVRFVMHADLPRHIEGYYQETGRAGRDGEPADCILFYGAADRFKIEYFIEQKPDQAERDHAYQQLADMIRFVHATDCRTTQLLAHFGEDHDGGCGHCDNCLDPPMRFDATEDSRKLLSTVVRTQQRYGISYIVDVLRGSRAQRIKMNGHDALTVHGIGRSQSKAHWVSLAESLLKEGYLSMTVDEYRTLFLTEKSKKLLRGDVRVKAAVSRGLRV